MKGNDSDQLEAKIMESVRRYWGFEQLRPLQAEAISAEMTGRDSLVVLPTGGGKSLCYQVPPLLEEGRTDIVVSPLISLMKDQVDSLLACGYPAAAVHSGMDASERARAFSFIASGKCRLTFASPERLLTNRFLEFVGQRRVRAFAIDEAHCISHWGHDFRPEYRRLALLKERFPQASVHAYTATATHRVRDDIIGQLGLSNPRVLVDSFDRPNLVYRVIPRNKIREQVFEVIGRHRNEAVIVYCISRAETERVTSDLLTRGVRAAFYHAGMEPSRRRSVQDRFCQEDVDVIVATVAFGMGIDRSDVRCVIHTAMPKTIEHYQQETGRAGRDGLEAECVLFYSPADVLRWGNLLDRSQQEGPGEVRQAARILLEHMRKFCAPGKCRHQAILDYFGQTLSKPKCGACDVCLGETAALEEKTILAQKILSCVARVGQSFGIGHVVDVLRGAETQRIRASGHMELSTHGLLRESSRAALVNTVYQLIDQEVLDRTAGDYPILKLNAASYEVLRGHRRIWLLPTRRKSAKKTGAETKSWVGVDRDLFESLRQLRATIARQRGVPPFVVFSDASLRDMARKRPANEGEFFSVHGVGEKKLADFGNLFVDHIRAFAGSSKHVSEKAKLL